MASSKVCYVEGCSNPVRGRGMCNTHYLRVRKYGDPSVCKNPCAPRTRGCKVDGCAGLHHAKGYCSKHVQRVKAHGSVEGSGVKRAARGAGIAFLREAVAHTGDECLIWPFGVKPGGYPLVYWERKNWGAHRLVCLLSHGEPPRGRELAAHSCGNGHLGCVNPRHLRWATPSENEADKVSHGRAVRGERHPLSKLTEAAVSDIRAKRGIETQVALAARHGVSQAAVSRVQLGNGWNHV